MFWGSRLFTNVCLCLLEPTWMVGDLPRLFPQSIGCTWKCFYKSNSRGGGVHAEEVGPMDSWISAVILHFSNIGKWQENEKVQHRSGMSHLSRVDGTLSSQVDYTELASKAERPSESMEHGLLSRVCDAMASEILHTLRLCVFIFKILDCLWRNLSRKHHNVKVTVSYCHTVSFFQ